MSVYKAGDRVSYGCKVKSIDPYHPWPFCLTDVAAPYVLRYWSCCSGKKNLWSILILWIGTLKMLLEWGLGQSWEESRERFSTHLAWCILSFSVLQPERKWMRRLIADLVTMAIFMLLPFIMHLSGSEEPWERKCLLVKRQINMPWSCTSDKLVSKWADRGLEGWISKARRPLLTEERDLRDTQTRPRVFPTNSSQLPLSPLQAKALLWN